MMGRITDLFGAKRHKTPPEAPMAIPIVVDIVVSRPDTAGHRSPRAAAAATAAAAANAPAVPATTARLESGPAEAGIESSASHSSLTDLELPGTPKGCGSGSVRSSAWQRIRHNNALGGLVRPLKRSKSQEKLRAALTNAAAKSEESAAAAAAAAALAASPPAPSTGLSTSTSRMRMRRALFCACAGVT